MTTAIIEQIISVSQHNDDEIEFTVLCTDGVTRSFIDFGFTGISAGWSFQYDDKLEEQRNE